MDRQGGKKDQEEELEVVRKSLELRKRDMQEQLEELKELTEANAKAEAVKIKDNDLEQGKNDMDVGEAGSEERLQRHAAHSFE